MSNNISIQQAAPQLVKAREIAARYSVTPACVFEWAKRGKIPSLRFQGVVRFPLADVIAAIEGRSISAHVGQS